jgi:hypothetical protein
VPDAERLPAAVAIKFRFSVHADPFQYSVELVAVPSATTPSTVAQKVEVPEVDRNCPNVPVALFVSRNSPVMRNLSIVVEARYERPEAVKLPVTVEVPTVAVLAVR